MRFPPSMAVTLATYILRHRLRPRPEWQRDGTRPDAPPGDSRTHPLLHKRFPLVLMLEPLEACNLSCTGCGRIREYQDVISDRLPLEACLRAAEECGAPVVSIAGGEPLLYPQIGALVQGLLARNRFVYLCTNGLLLRKRLAELRPHPRLFLNIHLDGLEETHDRLVERRGVFQEAIAGFKAAKAAGFRVSTNTTIYKETDMEEVRRLFEYLAPLKPDAHMISPAYSYSAVDQQEIFMTREDVQRKFQQVRAWIHRFPVTASPVYLEFLQGKRELPCTPWGNPTYNIKGWKAPCYLITDAHHRSFQDMMTQTCWSRYGPGRDPRCQHCMVHCGFEPSAALGINARAGDLLKLLRWAVR